MGERINRLSEAWDASSLLQLMAPVFCVAWEAMLFSRAAFLGDVAGANLSAGDPWWLLGMLTVGCCLLFVRHRRPPAVLAGELVFAVAGSAFGWLPLMYFPPMVALYACAARGPWRVSFAGAACYLLVMAFALAIDAGISLGPDGASLPGFSAGGIISNVMISLVLVGVALASHVRWDRRRTAAEERRREAEREAEMGRLAAARDTALAKSRIAAELHDSVGHDLTAIIALSEGLTGAAGDAGLDAALADINELARAGLADTRRAVRALARDVREAAPGAPGPWTPAAWTPGALGALAGGGTSEAAGTRASDGLDAPVDAGVLAPFSNCCHSWAEIPALLDTTRAAGIAAALTETGRRSPSADQADLAFRIVCESVTNALRHAPGLARITVSLDHGEGGTVAVTVRNDGVGRSACPASEARGVAGAAREGAVAEREGTGMGLARLRDLVVAAGGTFSAGLDGSDGWTVRAHLDGSAPSGSNTGNGEVGDGEDTQDAGGDSR